MIDRVGRIEPSLPSTAYRAWVLGLLFVVYTSNFVDRTIVVVLQQPIKEELGLSDAELGVLGGFAFAIFYATLGLPIARLAERYSRSAIISISLVVWSGATALCGFARGYGALFACRIGVGIGEAGAGPAANSLIADYFPPERRASALSIYSLGIPVGALLGSVIGGIVAQHYGWRYAFFVVGLPGIVLAAVTALTLREPPRGLSDAGITSAETPPFMAVVRHLLAKRSFVHVAVGTTLAAFASYGIGAFSTPYFIRAFHMSLEQAGVILGLSGFLSSAIGTLGGGLVTDRLAARDRRWWVWVPAIGLALCAPMTAAGYLMPSLVGAILVLIPPPVLQYSFLGPSFAVMHNMVPPRMRATSTALLLFAINLVGLGFGPMSVGWLSDRFAARGFAGLHPDGVFAALCPGGRAIAGAAPMLAGQCQLASAIGLRWGIVACTLVFVWAAAHFALAARRLRGDLEG